MADKNKIYLYGSLSALLYLSLYLVEPLKRFLGDGAITPSSGLIFILSVYLLLLLFVFYLYAYRQVALGGASIKTIFLFFALFNLLGLFLWPVASKDLFGYLSQGRVAAVHGASPYGAAYDQFTDDSFYEILKSEWTGLTSPYGPLYLSIASGLATLGAGNLILAVFLFKLSAVLFNFLNFFLIFKIFKDVRAVFLYAWNPLIIYEFAVNGHNDVITIFFVLLSVFFLFKTRPSLRNCLLSWIMMLLASLLKFLPLLLLPVLFLVLLNRFQGRAKLNFAGLAILSAALVFFGFYWPFWAGPKTVAPIFSYAFLKDFGLFKASPLIAALWHLSGWLGASNPAAVAVFLGKTAFLVFYFILLVKLLMNHRKLRDNDLLKYGTLIIAVFLTCFLSWLMPWYLINLMVLVILYAASTTDYGYKKYLYFLTLYAIIYYTIVR